MPIRFHVLSFVKMVVGRIMVWGVYVYVDPLRDPLAALGFGVSGLFLGLWGLSYYLVYGFLWLLLPDRSVIHTISYKISLIVGGFLLMNVLLFFLEWWTIWSGLALVGLFLSLSFIVFSRRDYDVSGDGG